MKLKYMNKYDLETAQKKLIFLYFKNSKSVFGVRHSNLGTTLLKTEDLVSCQAYFSTTKSWSFTFFHRKKKPHVAIAMLGFSALKREIH